MANSCKNTFSKGQFTQELIGSLLTLSTAANPRAAANGRVAAPAAPTASGSRSITSNSGNGYQDEASQNADGNGASAPSGYQNEEQQNADNGPPTPQPVSPPGAPTSSGDVTPSNNPTPPNMPGPNATADQFNINGVQPTPDELAARNAYRAAGSPSSGPLYDSYASSKAAFASRIADARSATTSTPPQVIAKDDS